MSIKIVINGYYRSGTSFIGEELRKVSGYNLYYEPLHPQLSQILKDQSDSNSTVTSRLHELDLWRDYSRLEEKDRLRILVNHPGRNRS